MPEQQNSPDPPNYSLARIGKLKAKILQDDSLISVLDSRLTGESIETLRKSLVRLMPGYVDPTAIRDSLLPMAGMLMTDDESNSLAWRMAANVGLLKNGIAVPPWTVQRFDEWMPLQVTNCRLARNARGDLGGVFTFRVIAGTAATMSLDRFWTSKFCGYFSQYFGFSKPWGNYPFTAMSQFVLLYFYGLFRPAKDSQPSGELTLASVRNTHGIMKRNRETIRSRARIKFDCPRKLGHECHLCLHGYDECQLGTHARTYVRGDCDMCHNKNALMDPLQRIKGVCVNCVRKRATSRKKD